MKSIRFLFITSFFFVTLIQTTVAQVFTDEIFIESFMKGQGPFSATRIINVDTASPAQILFLNGALDPLVDSVVNGSIALNGQTVFSVEDFKIDNAIVLKEIPLVAGDNVLDIDLKGSSGGLLTLQILRPFTFPAGTVLVSPDGIDASDCGSQLAPCETIVFGIAQAQATAGSQVAVAAGVYVENVSLVAGIDVLGGFDKDFTGRDIQASRAVVRGDGTAAATIVADSISVPTVFEGFFVMGPVVTAGTSIGLVIRGSTDALEVRHNTVLGGRAGDGSDEVGAAGGQNGTNGANGQAAFSIPPSTTASNPGGAGGVNTGFGQNISGGNGGTARQPNGGVESGDDGANGRGPTPGLGGDTGDDGTLIGSGLTLLLPSNPHNGSDGTDGAPGLPGASGSGGVGLGALVINIWTTPPGGPGGNGPNGSGGGGGGAGGGAESTVGGFNDVVGPSGGGGGSGGAGGSGGSGAEGGGSTFGIFVIIAGTPTSLPVITDNEIYLGIAGRGGKGGDGGLGGNGGQGGLRGFCGVTPFGCGGAGAAGQGGRGGPGGGGGGGAGGISVGIFSNFVGGYDTQNTIFTNTGIGGAGGTRGFSLGNSGTDGAPGGVFDILEL